jgi:hypothetical protein
MKVACDYILEIHQLIVDNLTSGEIVLFMSRLEKINAIQNRILLYPIQYKYFSLISVTNQKIKIEYVKTLIY